MQAAPAPKAEPNVLSRQVLAQGGGALSSSRSPPLPVRRTPPVPDATLIPKPLLPVAVLVLIWVPVLFPSTRMPSPLLIARLWSIWQPVQSDRFMPGPLPVAVTPLMRRPEASKTRMPPLHRVTVPPSMLKPFRAVNPSGEATSMPVLGSGGAPQSIVWPFRRRRTLLVWMVTPVISPPHGPRSL